MAEQHHIRLSISGMSCAGCVATVENALCAVSVMVDASVNLADLAIIGLIIWWIWLSRPDARRLEDTPITIVAEDGVYSPAHIEVSRRRLIVV